MGFVEDFILMNELRATKIAFANLPPSSQQIALREFRDLTSKSESCDSKETISATAFERHCGAKSLVIPQTQYLNGLELA